MAESAQDQRRREIAALLVELHDDTKSTRLRRAAVLDRWVRAYPEDAAARPGVARGGGPGSRAGARVRQGLAEWERDGAVRRAGDTVLLLNVDALRAAAGEQG